MSDKPFRVDQVDHVEFFVPNRHDAAAWYERVLGLKTIAKHKDWALHPQGPLMISPDSGNTKLALFEGTPQGKRATAGFHLVAFRVSADAFVEFLQRADRFELKNPKGDPVAMDSAVDHGQAYSVYFVDPYGHRLEVTTYEYDKTTDLLGR